MTNSQLKTSAHQMLESNILRFWSERMVDTQHGGFYGRIDGHDILHPEAEKGAVLNARILWTFAAATRVLHRMPYRILAARAKDYFLTHFVDPQYGGVSIGRSMPMVHPSTPRNKPTLLPLQSMAWLSTIVQQVIKKHLIPRSVSSTTLRHMRSMSLPLRGSRRGLAI